MDCSPARISSIMNGVHCHTRLAITDARGNRLTQSTWCTPNGDSTKLTIPNNGSSIEVFHTSAAATGVTRNGVISSVRAIPRPRKARSRSKARRRPSTTEINTVPTISKIVLSATFQNWLSWTTSK